ncbi:MULTISPECIES: hypothetical protein [Aphanothece]|uniref:hypothetical protein n=1 Tax=Aphanothece TaxID=1121 RepID=UPI00398526D0
MTSTPFGFSKEQIQILKSGGINDEMASFLEWEASTWSISKSIEIGVASGIGSNAIIKGGSPEHHGVDINTRFYRDKNFPTGALALHHQAFYLHIGTVKDVIQEIPKVNFVYIDADHRHPFPTLDLWNMEITDHLEYPFKLILDDIGLAIAYRKSGFPYRGPLILKNALESHFHQELSPEIDMRGIPWPNQCSFVVDNSRNLRESLLQSFSFPFEAELDPAQVL